jgi:hypothetical protein
MRQFLLLSLSALVACSANVATRSNGGKDLTPTPQSDAGPGSDPGTGPAQPSIRLARVSGTVWAPGNAPGMVPDGHEIPVQGALVRVLPNAPEAIPDRVYCSRCVEVSGPNTLTGPKGEFTITNILPGTYFVVVEKGQFRRQTQVTLAEGDELALEAVRTTLPSIHAPETGDYVPRIAVATGSYDHLEDVLGKMKIGNVTAEGTYQIGFGSEAIDFYANGGRTYDSQMAGSFGDLVRDLDRMLDYHIIFIPCSGTMNTSVLQEPAVLQNIRDYVDKGGKLYVTDWSGEWHDNVFPAHITLGGSVDTPSGAYNESTGAWDTSLFGSADGSSYDSDNAEVKDETLYTWLDGQQGPTPDGGDATFDASALRVVDNWNTIDAVTPLEIGVDDEGNAIMSNPKTFVVGGQGTSEPKQPLTVTYEPAGCGRVLFSTYHTTETAHAGLVPQERILLYLIMEIGVCQAPPTLI